MPVSVPCPTVLKDQATLEAGIAILAAHDGTVMATLLGDRDAPALRRRDSGFEGLAAIIVAQQVSTASANAIFARLKAHFGGTLEAVALLTTSDAELRLCGLSAPKQKTLRAIAEAIVGGSLDFDTLATGDAEAAHAALVAVSGIGPWTADVFLLFCLGHADAWPAGDLALQEAARLVLELRTRPTTKELIVIGERWRPLRGVAAHCLWAYYGAARQRLAPLEEAKPPKAKPGRGKTRKA